MPLVTHGLTAVPRDGLESWAYIFSTRTRSEAMMAGVDGDVKSRWLP